MVAAAIPQNLLRIKNEDAYIKKFFDLSQGISVAY
jgi:hypothetical protein